MFACRLVRWTLKVERWKEDGFNTFPVVYLHTLFYRMNIATLCIYACLKLALCSYVVHDMCECVCVLCNWFVILSNIELFSLIGYVSSFSHSLNCFFRIVCCLHKSNTNKTTQLPNGYVWISYFNKRQWVERKTNEMQNTYTHIHSLTYLYSPYSNE